MSDFPPPPPSSMPPWPPGDGGMPPQSTVFVYPPIPPKSRADLPTRGKGAPGLALQRAVALLLDYLLIFSALYSSQISPFVKVKANKIQSINLPLRSQLILWAAPVVYGAVCIAFRGQTIGGWILGVRVVRYVDGGSVPPYQALIRALVPSLPPLVASALPGSLGGFVQLLQPLVWVSIAFDPLLRGFHDKAAGTIVLRSR